MSFSAAAVVLPPRYWHIGGRKLALARRTLKYDE